ncbi:MAG: histidine ammonia-lyase [Polyangiales bacterium]
MEGLVAAQGVDLRGLAPGLGVRAAHACIRTQVAKLDGDRTLHPDMAAVRRQIADRSLQAAVEGAIGPLL